MELTQSYLKSVLNYDPDTGVFAWRVSRGRVGANSVAGTRHYDGYVQIKLDSRKYSAHRLAWLYMHGVWPAEQIDHINGVKDDNRIGNLREATNGENIRNRKAQSNNALGIKGLWYRTGKKSPWYAQINAHGRYYSKRFNHQFAAQGWLCQMRKEHHGEFRRDV